LLIRHDVVRLEAVLNVHAEITLRQVAHMAEAAEHGVAGTEVFFDGLRLRGGFHDHQVVTVLSCHACRFKGAKQMPFGEMAALCSGIDSFPLWGRKIPATGGSLP